MNQTLLKGNICVRTPPYIFSNMSDLACSLDSTEKAVCTDELSVSHDHIYQGHHGLLKKVHISTTYTLLTNLPNHLWKQNILSV